jgi:hypothetical protein
MYKKSSIKKNEFKQTIMKKSLLNADLIVGTELYDYDKDPNETINVADEKEYKSVAKGLKAKMLAYFAAQVK